MLLFGWKTQKLRVTKDRTVLGGNLRKETEQSKMKMWSFLKDDVALKSKPK